MSFNTQFLPNLDYFMNMFIHNIPTFGTFKHTLFRFLEGEFQPIAYVHNNCHLSLDQNTN